MGMIIGGKYYPINNSHDCHNELTQSQINTFIGVGIILTIIFVILGSYVLYKIKTSKHEYQPDIIVAMYLLFYISIAVIGLLIYLGNLIGNLL